MVEQKHPNPLHNGGGSIADHIRSLQEQASFSGITNPKTQGIQGHTSRELGQQPLSDEVREGNARTLRFSKELSLSAMFGIQLKHCRALAKILFGEAVDIDSITEKQRAKIEAMDRAINQGWEKLLRERRIEDIPLSDL